MIIMQLELAAGAGLEQPVSLPQQALGNPV
jgi:hypothetical protein